MGVSKDTSQVWLLATPVVRVVGAVSLFVMFGALSTRPVWADAECTVDAAAARPQLINGRYILTQLSPDVHASPRVDGGNANVAQEVRCRVTASEQITNNNRYSPQVEIREFVIRKYCTGYESTRQCRSRLRQGAQRLCSLAQARNSTRGGNASSQFGGIDHLIGPSERTRQYLDNPNGPFNGLYETGASVSPGVPPQRIDGGQFSIIDRGEFTGRYHERRFDQNANPINHRARVQMYLTDRTGKPACSDFSVQRNGQNLRNFTESERGIYRALRGVCRQMAGMACGGGAPVATPAAAAPGGVTTRVN